MDVFGSGFLVDAAGHILTNHHVLEPWWHNAREMPVPTDTFEPTILSMQAYFPGNETPMPLHVQSVSETLILGWHQSIYLRAIRGLLPSILRARFQATRSS